MALGTEDMERIKQEVAGIKDFYQSRMDAEIPPLQEEVGRISAQLGQMQEQTREVQRRGILESAGAESRPRVPYGKYQGMDLLDLACVRSVLAAQVREPSGLNPRMLEDWQSNLKAAMDSTTAGSGDELVPTAEAAALWLDVNLETLVAPLFSRVDMPTNPFEIPLQLGDVNWYPGTEKPGSHQTPLCPTARQTLTAYELVAEVPWSLTLDEDAVIAMSGEVRSSLVRNAVEVIDDVLLNADNHRDQQHQRRRRHHRPPAPRARPNGWWASTDCCTCPWWTTRRRPTTTRTAAPAPGGQPGAGQQPQRQGNRRYVQRGPGNAGPPRRPSVGTGLHHGRETPTSARWASTPSAPWTSWAAMPPCCGDNWGAVEGVPGHCVPSRCPWPTPTVR